MALVRRVQRKKHARYIAIPREIADSMSLKAGTHLLIHQINQRQIVYTKVDEDLPVIQLEKESE